MGFAESRQQANGAWAWANDVVRQDLNVLRAQLELTRRCVPDRKTSVNGSSISAG